MGGYLRGHEKVWGRNSSDGYNTIVNVFNATQLYI
jgi:hypothetical protein